MEWNGMNDWINESMRQSNYQSILAYVIIDQINNTYIKNLVLTYLVKEKCFTFFLH